MVDGHDAQHIHVRHKTGQYQRLGLLPSVKLRYQIRDKKSERKGEQSGGYDHLIMAAVLYRLWYERFQPTRQVQGKQLHELRRANDISPPVHSGCLNQD